jgi:redox-sensitive bicupin YhaK (pirin superfamily)
MPMNVPPHPHLGIQTVSWLLEGEAFHADSLGSQAVLRPGGVNSMTAGRGIAHAEKTPARNSGRLNGVQLWVALPNEHRHTEPSFLSVERVPVIEDAGGIIQLFAGSYGGVSSPAPYFSGIIGLDLQVRPSQAVEIELDPAFEHAALVLTGESSLENQTLQERTLYYLGTRRTSLPLCSRAGGRVLLIGGPPFPEQVLMWWNFVARTPEEIAQARADWEEGRRFGEVVGQHEPRMPAPSLARLTRPDTAS